MSRWANKSRFLESFWGAYQCILPYRIIFQAHLIGRSKLASLLLLIAKCLNLQTFGDTIWCKRLYWAQWLFLKALYTAGRVGSLWKLYILGYLITNGLSRCVQNCPYFFQSWSFGISTQYRFCTRWADHDPALVVKEILEAVEGL